SRQATSNHPACVEPPRAGPGGRAWGGPLAPRPSRRDADGGGKTLSGGGARAAKACRRIGGKGPCAGSRRVWRVAHRLLRDPYDRDITGSTRSVSKSRATRKAVAARSLDRPNHCWPARRHIGTRGYGPSHWRGDGGHRV